MARKVDKSIKICVICGDRAKGINFNVLTCMSCKAFFRRNALRKKDMKCPFDDTCRINKITRKFCSKCRLKKCFESGMKKEWILSEEEKRLIKDKIIRNKLRKQKMELVKQPQKQNEENVGQSNSSSSNSSISDENPHNINRKPGPTRSNGRRGRNNGTIKLSTMANQKNNVYKSNKSKKMLIETVSSHYSLENSTTISPPAANNLQFAENQFPCIPPESSVKYFQPTTSPSSLSTSSSSSLSVYHLLTEPSSYGLDTLLSYEETIDVFQHSSGASSSFSTIQPFSSKNGTDFSKLKLLSSSFNHRKPSNQIHYHSECGNHRNIMQQSNNANNLPQGVSYNDSAFSNINYPHNGDNDNDILKKAISLINNDISEMKGINNNANSDNNANLGKLSEISPLNMAECFNVDLGEKGLDVDPDQSLSFLTDIDDGGLRFSSSSISSSLSDCCFLFSNSIDSIDFFDDDFENLEFNPNNTHANHTDSTSFLNTATAANNGNSNQNQSTNMPNMKNVLFPEDNKGDKACHNNAHYPIQKSNEFSDQQSIQPSLSNHQSPTLISKTSTNTESVTDFEFTKPEYQNVYDLVDNNNNIDNNVDHQRAKTESNPNVEVFNIDADFSQYLLHDNDPPLTITAKTINNQAKNIAKHSLPPLSLSTKTSHMLNSKDEVDDYCDDVSGLVNDGHVTNLNTGISYLTNFDRKIDNLTSNNANGQLQNQQALSAVKVEPFSPNNLHNDGYNAKNFVFDNINNNNNNHYDDSFCNNHHDYDPMVQMTDQNAFQLFREIHFSNNELMLPERYFILELTNACSILQNPYKRIMFHNFHNNRHKCRLTEFFLHRLIRMPKRIHSFNNLLFEDQFKLIKNGIIEIFSLRSVLLYDPDRDALSFLDDKCKISLMVKLELLKPFCIKYGFKRHREFYGKFMHEWKCDNTIFDLMTAIILFTPRPDVERFDIIREEHLRYTQLLKRYLEIKYDGQDAENTFIKLMALIDEMRLLNEDILRMFKVNAKASKAGPLFVQLLDLNVLQPQPQKQSVKILDNDFIHDGSIETMNMVNETKNSYNNKHQNIVEIGMKSEHNRLMMMDKSSLVAQDSCVTSETSTTMNTNNNNNNNNDNISSSLKTVQATFSNNGCCYDAGPATATSLFTTNATNHHTTNNNNNSARTYLECFQESVQ